MKPSTLWTVCLVAGIFGIFLFAPHMAFADDFGGIGADPLAQRVNGLTSKIIGTILPAISILGLVYSAILAASGDQSSKARMILVLIACAVGLLAPVVIHWLQAAVGSGF